MRWGYCALSRINVHHDKDGNLSRLSHRQGIARNRLNRFIPVRGVDIGAGMVALTLIGYPVQDVQYALYR